MMNSVLATMEAIRTGRAVNRTESVVDAFDWTIQHQNASQPIEIGRQEKHRHQQ